VSHPLRLVLCSLNGRSQTRILWLNDYLGNQHRLTVLSFNLTTNHRCEAAFNNLFYRDVIANKQTGC
jgi:hypothetical protein